MVAPAQALELVPGGYGSLPEASSQESPAPFSVDGSANEPGLSLEFTPRASVSPWSGGADTDDLPLSFGLTVRANSVPTVPPTASSPTSRDALRASTAANQFSLTVGGAMRWSDWSVGGGLGRAHVLGEDVDLMAATLGYGRVRAEIAYGQSQPTSGVPQDVLMLSTDLAAWSWLTLESNLALGSRSANVDGAGERNRDAVAAGRLGLRLNF
ncbi:MAG: hypothetical protein AB7I59_08805 [Geminicoccaceae bacterium]